MTRHVDIAMTSTLLCYLAESKWTYTQTHTHRHTDTHIHKLTDYHMPLGLCPPRHSNKACILMLV